MGVSRPFPGLYPLHLAVRRDGERCLRLLVEGGAKINEPEQKSGNTALHLAVRENLFKVACTLITEVAHTRTSMMSPPPRRRLSPSRSVCS